MANTRISWGLLASWSVTTVSVALAVAALYVHQNLPQAQPERVVVSAPQPAPMPIARVSGTAGLPAGEGSSWADVAEQTMPAVVNIFTVSVLPSQGGLARGQSLGSGVIVATDGLVVTNHHVVANAAGIRVHLSDGRDFGANVVGTDQLSDMALLRLVGSNGTPVSVPAIGYGDSSSLRPGEPVLAIGNPFGVGQTVTMGIVSAIGRANMGITEYEDFIQTDAAINPGNSGGALVSTRGELIGINTAIVSRSGGSQGIGFAIPSNMVRPIVDSLLAHGKVVRGWLGVGIQDVNQDVAQQANLGVNQGVLVTGVEPGSPAEQAGIASGDVLVELDGERLSTSSQLRNLVATRGANRVISMVRIRAGARETVRVQLRERPQGATALQNLPGLPNQGAPGRRDFWPFGR